MRRGEEENIYHDRAAAPGGHTSLLSRTSQVEGGEGRGGEGRGRRGIDLSVKQNLALDANLDLLSADLREGVLRFWGRAGTA